MELKLHGSDEVFPFAEHIGLHCGFPIVDWVAVNAWIDSQQTEEARAETWAMCERAWLLHFLEAVGDRYSLIESETAALLSPLEPNVARATLDYLNNTQERICKVLDGVAEFSGWGKDILIVLESEDAYYEYISHCYPDEGEFAFSSGVFLSTGCAHFVTVQSDMRWIEPVIAHEMTHSSVSHLPIPLWLNEGLAVNTERHLTGTPVGQYTPRELQAMHREFWGAEEIQEFWSGKSFSRTDEGNLLSYDLARILVEQFAKDWPRFKAFVLAAHERDAGAEAAQHYLEVSLGDYVSLLLDKPGAAGFDPVMMNVEGGAELSAA